MAAVILIQGSLRQIGRSQMASDPLTEALAAISRFEVVDASVGDTLQRLAEIAVDAVPAAAFAGMTMLSDDGGPTTAVFTDVASPEIDQGQYRDGVGPCLDAWREGTIVHLDAVADADERYPAFVASCREHGIESTLSLPMAAQDRSIGALNLYAHAKGSFTHADQVLAGHLARVSGTVLGYVSAYWTQFNLAQNLDQAMKTRAVIEQAKGMLMGAPPYPDADEAFDLLRQASQRENVKVNVLAQRIVDTRRPEDR